MEKNVGTAAQRGRAGCQKEKKLRDSSTPKFVGPLYRRVQVRRAQREQRRLVGCLPHMDAELQELYLSLGDHMPNTALPSRWPGHGVGAHESPRDCVEILVSPGVEGHCIDCGKHSLRLSQKGRATQVICPAGFLRLPSAKWLS